MTRIISQNGICPKVAVQRLNLPNNYRDGAFFNGPIGLKVKCFEIANLW